MELSLRPPAIGLAAASAAMALLWLVQRRTGNAGIVDVAWAATIGVLGVAYASGAAGASASATWLAGAMTGFWSLRLTSYLFHRVVGRPEEGRYAALRVRWGAAAGRRMFWFYQFQAVAAWAFASPVMAVRWSRAAPGSGWTALAVGLWIAGVGGTALADWQLAAFKRRAAARGKTCRDGLWRYSRHPNYFFEWIHWCAYIPLAIESPGWWIPIAVAGTLLYLVLFVTGIPPTEAQAAASRGEDYREYQRTTSPFVPWFPKKTTPG